MVGHARQDGDGNPSVYMLPASHEHMNMDEHEDAIPEKVLEYCKTAQDIYFSGNLMATNVFIKTAMETMFEHFLPLGNSKADLPSMIRDSISVINHNEPLAKLISSTAKEGDLHTLLQNRNSTDKPTADAMIELLETLILYLYILPKRFAELETRFSELNSSDNAENPTTQKAEPYAFDMDLDNHPKAGEEREAAGNRYKPKNNDSIDDAA